MHAHCIILSLLAAITVAQSPYEACYGNVAYCAGVGSPIILRCDGTGLGPGNCDDNLNHPQFGAICIESSNTAGNAICSAVGSSAPPFPSVTGGLGTPTRSSTVVVSTTTTSSSSSQVLTSTSSSASASSESSGSIMTVTVTLPCNATMATSTSHATSSGSATAGNSILSSSSAASVKVTPTPTNSATPVFTGAAVSFVRGGKDVFGLVMASAVVMGTMIAGGGIFWLLV